MGRKDKRKATAHAMAVRMAAFYAQNNAHNSPPTRESRVDIEDDVNNPLMGTSHAKVDGGILFVFGYHRSSNVS